MISDIKPERIANSILQNLKVNATYLIIEGIKDLLVYNKFMNENHCEIRIAHGNQNVLQVVEILKSRGFLESIGILDADFRVLDNEIIESQDLFFTDFHDVEMMVFDSPAFETIINHYVIEEKLIELLKERAPKNLRSIFLELIAPLGYLKWVNIKFNLGLVFKPTNPEGKTLNFSEFISISSLEFLGYDKLIQAVLNYSQNKSKSLNTSMQDAKEKINILINNDIDLYQLCNGHDLVSLISLALRRKISNKNSNACSEEQIQRELMLAYDSRHFERTKLYNQIKAWEEVRKKIILRF